jgi:hypothetical protein
VLRLVRPRSYALALGLGLVASEICIPLIQRCLCAPCLYSAELVVLRDLTNRACGVAATVYRREQDPRRFGWKLDSEDGGERFGRGLPEGTSETHLRVGKARGYPRSYPTGSLALARDSLRGAPTRTRGKLERFSIPRYIGVVDGSLHLYLILTFRIYIATLVVCFTFLA